MQSRGDAGRPPKKLSYEIARSFVKSQSRRRRHAERRNVERGEGSSVKAIEVVRARLSAVFSPLSPL